MRGRTVRLLKKFLFQENKKTTKVLKVKSILRARNKQYLNVRPTLL